MASSSRRGVARALLLALCALAFPPRLARAWSPVAYRMMFYANRNPELRTWMQLAEVEFYDANGIKKTVTSVDLLRGTHYDGTTSLSSSTTIPREPTPTTSSPICRSVAG